MLILLLSIGIIIPLAAMYGWWKESILWQTCGTNLLPMQFPEAIAALLIQPCILCLFYQKWRLFSAFMTVLFLILANAVAENLFGMPSIALGLLGTIHGKELDPGFVTMSLQSSFDFLIFVIVAGYIAYAHAIGRKVPGYAFVLVPLLHVTIAACISFAGGPLAVKTLWNGLAESPATELALIVSYLSLMIVIHHHNDRFPFWTSNFVIVWALAISFVSPGVIYVLFDEGYYGLTAVNQAASGRLRLDLGLLIACNIVLLLSNIAGAIRSMRDLNEVDTAIDSIGESQTIMISAAAHDVAAPIKMAHQLLDMSRQDLIHQRYDQAKQSIDMISDRFKYVEASIDSIIDFGSATVATQTVDRISVRQLVSEAAENADPEGRAQISINVPEEILDLPRMPLTRIIQNLARNAIVHHDRADIRIDIDGQISRRSLTITLVDNGPGIPQNLQDTIFEPHRSFARSGKARGSGLGLASVYRQLQSLGGSIDLCSPCNDGRGTQFSITVPLHR